MSFWLVLTGVFLVQEPVSTNAVLLEALHLGYPLFWVHVLFATATVFDIVCGYVLGEYLRKRFQEGKVAAFLKQRFATFADFSGKAGTRSALLFLGPFIFPFSPVVTPWLGISFTDTLIFIFIGNVVIWYGFEWLLVLGANTFFPDPYYAFYALLIGSGAIALCTKYFLRRFFP